MLGTVGLSLLTLAAQDPAAAFEVCSPPAVPDGYTVLVPFGVFDPRPSIAQVRDLHEYHSGRRNAPFSERMNSLNEDVRNLFNHYRTGLMSVYEGHRIEFRVRHSVSAAPRDRHFRHAAPPGYQFDTSTWSWEGSGLRNHWQQPDQIAIHMRGHSVAGWGRIEAVVPQSEAVARVESCLEVIRSELIRLHLPTDRTPDFPPSVDTVPSGQ